MLRATQLRAVGRWQPLDQLKGKSKPKGARSCQLGTRGHVPRWSKKHGFRDDMPQGNNKRLFNKFGVKSGGLQGRRVPGWEMQEYNMSGGVDWLPDITNRLADVPHEERALFALLRAAVPLSAQVLIPLEEQDPSTVDHVCHAAAAALQSTPVPMTLSIATRTHSATLSATPNDADAASALVCRQAVEHLVALAEQQRALAAFDEDADADRRVVPVVESAPDGVLIANQGFVAMCSLCRSGSRTLAVIARPLTGTPDTNRVATSRDTAKWFMLNHDPRRHICRDLDGVGTVAHNVRCVVVVPPAPLPRGLQDALGRRGFLSVSDEHTAAVAAVDRVMGQRETPTAAM